MEPVISLQRKEIASPGGVTGEFCQALKKTNTYPTVSSKEIEEKETPLSSFSKTCCVLIPKPHKDTTRKPVG